MTFRQLHDAIKRISRRTKFHAKRQPFPRTFHVELSGRGRYCGVVMDLDGVVVELWECDSLNSLRRLACGYHPSLSRAFGSARIFAGV